MPTKDFHKHTIARNKQFQLDINTGKLSDKYNEWQIVSLFYAAVHTVDLTLHVSGYCDATDHEDRFTMLKQEIGAIGGYNAEILTYYRDLYTMSKWARYECKVFSLDEVGKARRTLHQLEVLARLEREKIRKNSSAK
jgi:hypothetical protein